MLRKWFHLHEHAWSEWKDKQDGKIHTVAPESKLEGVTGYYIIQERRCSDCGAVDLRTAKTSFGRLIEYHE